jgi:hypothetical protein
MRSQVLPQSIGIGGRAILPRSLDGNFPVPFVPLEPRTAGFDKAGYTQFHLPLT